MSIDAFGRPTSGWVRAVRSKCSDCGSADIRWFLLRDLAWQVAPAERLRVFELLDFLGARAASYICDGCGLYGAFGPDEGWLAL